MTLSKTILTILVAGLPGALSAAQDKLPDAVRNSTGNIELWTTREFSPADLPDLVGKSEVIAHVVVERAQSRLSRDERRIETDYGVRVIESYRAKRELNVGTPLTVTRAGGALTIEGRMIFSRESDFPPFQPGEEYVLFLAFNPQLNAWIIPFGSQGAFLHGEGYDEQVSESDGKTKAERGRIRADAFAEEIREAATHRDR